MRVVVSCVPQTGHILPLLPLAQAFAAQGDDVVVASGPDAEQAVSSLGLEFRRAGPDLGSWFEALRARTRGVPGDGLEPSRVLRYFVPRLFGEVGMALMLDELLELSSELRPSLLVFDPYLFAAPLVAELTGAHAVQHSIGPLLGPDVLELVADAVSPIWREFGRDVPPAAGVYRGTTLTICPPSLDPAGDGLEGAQPLRPVPPPLAEATALRTKLADPGRPLVYLTLGTFSNTAVDLFRLVLGALKDEPVNVLATIGRDNDPADLEPVPANARVERFIPQAELLPHCAAVVHHAGAGTSFGALAHGLPSLALPQSADNFVIAARLAKAGAAHMLMPGEVTTGAVLAGLRALLAAPTYLNRARDLAGEIAAMPSHHEVAARLRANV
ncbi:MAG: glycosyltransferase [Acidimicrobiales bacterium]|jgi:UDP:flavonoid glycosyltransferase YjiC (YdhE family)